MTDEVPWPRGSRNIMPAEGLNRVLAVDGISIGFDAH